MSEQSELNKWVKCESCGSDIQVQKGWFETDIIVNKADIYKELLEKTKCMIDDCSDLSELEGLSILINNELNHSD